jgi:peptidoglycan/xylan/chitin deacetylase (PgdA/CDA1 family)
VLSRDWTNPGVETIVSRTLAKVKSGAVILLHDGDGVAAATPRAQTVAAARQIICELKAQGYKFVTVGEILKTEE